MKLLLRWLISAVTLLIIAYYIPGIRIIGVYPALIAALFLGLVNAVIRPLAVALTLPITIVTLGLFTLVINALLFWFVSSFVKGFDVSGFVPAFWGALIMSLVGWGTNMLLKKS